MAKLERIYTVPLGEAYEAVRNRRVPKAVKILREFAARHMKGERVVLSEALNKHLWQKSIQKPPRRVKVRLIKEDGMINAYLADEKVEEKPKKEDKPAAKKEAAKKPEDKKEAKDTPPAKTEKKEEKK